MASLGHTARVVLASRDRATAVAAWQALGFETTSEHQGITFLTDGQLLLGIAGQEFPFCSLLYLAAGVDPSTPKRVQSDFPLPIFQLGTPVDDAERVTKEQNPLLGYADAITIGVKDVNGAKAIAENCGFFVLEEYGQPYPQCDLTDGLITIALQEGFVGTYLTYITDIDGDLASDITASLSDALGDAPGFRVESIEQAGSHTSMIRISMPDGMVVLVSQDVD